MSTFMRCDGCKVTTADVPEDESFPTGWVDVYVGSGSGDSASLALCPACLAKLDAFFSTLEAIP